MTSRIAVLGFVVPIGLMASGLIQIFLFDDFSIPFSFIHLLVVFAFICIMSYLAKKKDNVKEFVCSYFVIAIPFILGFLCTVTVNLQSIENSFFQSSMSFDNLTFCLMLGGFVPVIDIIVLIRALHDAISGFDYFDVLLSFVFTTIVIVTPLIIYKLSKAPNNNNTQENSYGSKID